MELFDDNCNLTEHAMYLQNFFHDKMNETIEHNLALQEELYEVESAHFDDIADFGQWEIEIRKDSLDAIDEGFFTFDLELFNADRNTPEGCDEHQLEEAYHILDSFRHGWIQNESYYLYLGTRLAMAGEH